MGKNCPALFNPTKQLRGEMGEGTYKAKIDFNESQETDISHKCLYKNKCKLK